MELFLLQAKSLHLWDLLFGDSSRITRNNFQAILVEVYVAGAVIPGARHRRDGTAAV